MSSAPTPRGNPAPLYVIIDRQPLNYFDADLQRVISGRQLTVRWKGLYVFRVLVPDQFYTAEYVDTVIKQEGAREDALSNVGN